MWAYYIPCKVCLISIYPILVEIQYIRFLMLNICNFMQMRLWKNCTWSMLQFSSVAQSCPTLCDPMDARPPCPSPTPRVCPNSCPLNLWCHPTISFSVIPFSSHLQSSPASGSFPMNQLFASGGQSIGSFSFNISPSNEYSGLISFRMVSFRVS